MKWRADTAMVEGLIDKELAAKTFPGLVLLVEKDGKPVYSLARGFRQLHPEPEAMSEDTIFDLASLTKPLATALLTLHVLFREGIPVERPVGSFLAGISPAAAGITLAQLLLHTACLPPVPDLYLNFPRAEEIDGERAEGKLLAQEPLAAPGSQVIYSCTGYLILGLVLRKLTGLSLGRLFQQVISGPGGIPDLLFLPRSDLHGRTAPAESSRPDLRRRIAPAESSRPDLRQRVAPAESPLLKLRRRIAPAESPLLKLHRRTAPAESPLLKLRWRIAPTEYCSWRKRWLRGEVHDENAYCLGGEGGNAGLFGTARSVLDLLALFTAGGVLRGVRILPEAALELMRTDLTPGLNLRRSMGFLMPDQECPAGPLAGPQSFGHTGFTGTSVWIDPLKKLKVVLLTNRVHLGRDNTQEGIIAFRPAIHSALYRVFG